MSSESLVAVTKPPIRLLDLPSELVLSIFHQVAVSSDSSEDLVSLATSSKRLYGIFKENELGIIRRATAYFLAVPKRPMKEDPMLADFVLKIAVLLLTKPWPVAVDDVKAALARAQDASAPLAVDASMHGRIMAWVRSEVAGRSTFSRRWRWVDEEARKLEYKRVYFRLWHGLVILEGPDVQHPFDWIDPAEILHVFSEGGHRFHCYRLKRGLAEYEAHANHEVTDSERALFGTEGHVACCVCEECPRFAN